jgi:hypothetical protein
MFYPVQQLFGQDIILKEQKEQFLSLFEDEGIKRMEMDLLDSYMVAKDRKDFTRVDHYKKKIQDYFLLDKNMLRAKVCYHKETWIADLDAFIDNEDKDLFVSKQMPIRNLRIEKPVELAKYDKRIPAPIYKRLGAMDSIFKDKGLEYYIADVVADPDPILIIQVDGKKEHTFIVGAWE